MDKVNVTGFKAAATPFQEFRYEDPETQQVDDEGAPIKGTGTIYGFKLRPLTELEMGAAGAFGDELVRRFLTGGYRDPQGDYRERPEILAMIPFDDGTERPAEMSDDALRLFAFLERAQGIKRSVFDDDPKEGYVAKELALLVETKSHVFDFLRESWRSVRAERREKKARTAQNGQSSAQASEPAVDTPN